MYAKLYDSKFFEYKFVIKSCFVYLCRKKTRTITILISCINKNSKTSNSTIC